MSTTTTILDAAIARLVAMLRAIGGPLLELQARMIEADAHHVARGQAITDAAAALASHTRPLRWERKGADRDAAIADAARADTAALAASYITSALRAVNGYADPDEADRMALVALRLLAWPEAMAVVDAAERWHAAPGETLIDRMRAGEQAAGALDDAVGAYRSAVGITGPQTPSQAPTVADLLARVRGRLGPAELGATCTVRLGTHVTPPADVRWKRVYADGQCSDERHAEGETAEECLLAVLAHEDRADTKEPQHAGPPPPPRVQPRSPRIVEQPTLLQRVHEALPKVGPETEGAEQADAAKKIAAELTTKQRAALRWYAQPMEQRTAWGGWKPGRPSLSVRKRLHELRLVGFWDLPSNTTPLGRAVLAALPAEKGAST